jgi:glutamate-ammonia-ligase adenylyltransferase
MNHTSSGSSPNAILEAVAREVAESAGLDEALVPDILSLLSSGGGLAGTFVLDVVEKIATAAAHSADPRMALGNFARWVSQLGSASTVFRVLLEDPKMLEDMVTVFSASQYLSDILVRDPHYYDVFLDSRLRTAEEIYSEISAVVRAFSSTEAKLDVLRRVRRREILRIGLVDFTYAGGVLADQGGQVSIDALQIQHFKRVVEAISDLADALIRSAFDICSSPTAPPFAVIAMGKLGGRELNYSSDVDLLFVYDAPSGGDTASFGEANRLAERLVAALSKPTQEGYLFRCDIRLRPGGRSGYLARSLSAYLEHYNRGPDILERQALIKARFVAGDSDLGRRFMEATRPYAYQSVVPASFFDEVRANKEMLEQRAEIDGQTSVKEGRGGIRDVEFAVQFLQMLFGGRLEFLRTGNTLEAIERLTEVGLLSPEMSGRLQAAYVFLRTVEHRLQLLHDLPVRHIPSDEGELNALARRCGFSSAAEFNREYARCTKVVREAFTEIFHVAEHVGSASEGGRLRGLVQNMDVPAAQQAILTHLSEAGFEEPERAFQVLKRMALGTEAAPVAFAQRRALSDLAETLIREAVASAGPEDALELFEKLSEQMGSASFLRSLAEQKGTAGCEHALRVLCSVGGSAPVLAQILVRFPELVDAVLDPSFGVTAPYRDELEGELRARISAVRSPEGIARVLRRFRAKHLLRIGIADVLHGADVEQVCSQLTELADVIIAGALGPESGGFAVLGLGRLGGGEMQYGSDLDMMYLAASPDRQYLKMAEELNQLLTALTPEGRLYEVDLRLRPDGKSGRLSMSLEGALAYYKERAQVWEKQAMVKARFVAGDRGLADTFLTSVQPIIYPEPFPEEYAEEIRRMKSRIERERLNPEEGDRDLKLGIGGLSDVEFLVQLLQMRHGGGNSRLRQTNTLSALRELEACGILPKEDVRLLAEAYRFNLRTRNALYLLGAAQPNVIPKDQRLLARLAKRLGYRTSEELVCEHRELAAKARSIFESRFGPQPEAR